MEHTITVKPAGIDKDNLYAECYGIVTVIPLINNPGIELGLSQDTSNPTHHEMYWLVESHVGDKRLPFIMNDEEHYMLDVKHTGSTKGNVFLKGSWFFITVRTDQVNRLPQAAIILAKEAIKRYTDSISIDEFNTPFAEEPGIPF